MLVYTIRRLIMTIPVMGVVALVVFTLLYITPGDPAVVIAGDHATPEELAAIRQALGLDQGFLVRFGIWLWGVLQGDLGVSIFSNQPVTRLIGQRLMPTFSLLLFSMIIAIGVAVPFGVLAAWYRGRAFDRIFMVSTVLAFSIPVFVFGYMLAYTFSTNLRWFPVQGYKPPSEGLGVFLAHMTLPAVTLGLSYSALIARVTRASMLEVLSQDFIRTARAKGALPRTVLFRHALKNASVQIVTVIGLGIATLIGGSVVTETVFALPGIGKLIVDAILHRDYPVIQGIVLMFSLIKVIINLIVDLSYTLLDPRIRY